MMAAGSLDAWREFLHHHYRMGHIAFVPRVVLDALCEARLMRVVGGPDGSNPAYEVIGFRDEDVGPLALMEGL